MTGASLEYPQPPWDQALVVFSGQADLAWLHVLDPGFRHCFVVLGNGAGWVGVNAMAHWTEISVLNAADAPDLARHFRAQGLVVVETVPVQPPRKPAGWRPYSCVEEVKRVLGLEAPYVLTPRQLFCFLTNKGKNTLTPGHVPATFRTVTATIMTFFRRARRRERCHVRGKEQNTNI